MPQTVTNKQVVMDYVAAFNAGDHATLRGFFTEDAEVQGILGWGGMAVVMPLWQELHGAFAPQLTVESIIAESDTVAVRYTERGQFRGAFRGNAPTGRTYELVAMDFFILRDGLIHRRWGARDAASMARQVGLPPG